jgi:RNA polymerase sigma factor (sigma-70 family)
LSRGASGAVLAPVFETSGESAVDSDQRLVAAVRAGDDRAFEALYQRYQRRIHAYVLGMVKDHGRAEDVTQEVFVSALRRMRATDRAIAFKPWIYEIAKNACIDAFRRSRRAEEVSYDAEEGLAPADHSRLCATGPSPEAAVSAKHDLETLCGAFGGLSESHHQILVLRELEGLTYEQIGERMGMTRPAVESTLFRARRRLTEEYDELVSGARCMRVQSIIAAAVSGAVGVRDSRRLSRHLSHCQPCRREALAAGLDRGLLVRRPAAKRYVGKVASLLPFPAFLRFRRGVEGAPPSSEVPGARWAAHLPALSDQLSGPWAKAGAAAALLVAGTGAGIGAHQVATHRSAHPAVVVPAAHKTASSPVATATATGASVTAPAAGSRSGGGRGVERRRSGSSGGAGNSGSAVDRATSGGGATPSTPSTPSSSGSSGSSASGSSGASAGSADTKSGGSSGIPKDPVKKVTSAAGGAAGGAGGDAGAAVQGAVNGAADTVDGAVQGATGAVGGAVGGAGDTVNGAVQGLTGDGPVSGAVEKTTDTVNGAVSGLGDTVNGLTGTVTGTVRQTTGGLLGGNSAGR